MENGEIGGIEKITERGAGGGGQRAHINQSNEDKKQLYNTLLAQKLCDINFYAKI